MASNFVSPGTALGEESKVNCGVGTHALNGVVYASVFGKLQTQKSEDGKITYSVQTSKVASTVPEVGDVVLCKVTQINLKMVLLDIVLIEGHDLPSTKFPAILRSQDIRSFETDSVEVYSSYRPGDIVRAQIISLGDARSYYISTAKNDLGVIYSVGRGGVAMEVLSSEAMECPLTKTVEKRKVALTAQVKIE